ncbi:A disintegrin and metalloproteinase with thrombospondin motifs 7 [Sorex araneus]|uniref:A disintegrin and metalloproteinase with thrombospondin motifs 7 n=1 Tax=Sorex araneus TaxID=42254 RepID=UPI0003317D9F|nr:A disintegrin and metalloproteinase with thrombospondin motifs 7 [Sorex araneus]
MPSAAPLLLLLCVPGALGSAPAHLEAWKPLDIVHPVRVDARGSFLSFELWPRALNRREESARPRISPTFYELQFQGRALRFNLSANTRLLAPGFLVETRRRGGLGQVVLHPGAYPPACHLLGQVQSHVQRPAQGPASQPGSAAISACDGLKGVFQLSNEDYFIEPLRGVPAQPGQAQPHVLYQHEAPDGQGNSSSSATCWVQESPDAEPQRERWQQRHRRHQRQQLRRRHLRSVSKEKWVETLVVADTKMVEFHGHPHVESYVLTVMNMVAGLYHDPSIGNPIHITIVRLILLEDEEEDLKITHHADNTLWSFCKWQKMINPKGDSHPLHHDMAILLTRKDLCAARNQPCETLGMSHVAGMCQPHRSCSICEDTGLPLAFTVAHELGHSFGVQHDGLGNPCLSQGKSPFIMSPQLLYSTTPLTWSPCSRQYITRFLDRGWGMCLDDPPSKDAIDFPSVPPGILYDVGHQCRLQYGGNSVFCQDMDNVCHTLWCSVGTTCHSKLDAAVDGTRCGDNKWCLNGECVPVGFRPEAVDGHWSAWTSWSECTRSCGVGVQSTERQCTQPAPRYKGKYCVGERKRFRLCNLQSCPPGHPSFRQLQCSKFDTKWMENRQHTWVPVPNDVNPCELYCQSTNEHFVEKLLDAVVDGTPCYQNRPSRDVCINGICKNVGCDFIIDSGAVEDRCGVCKGDGSTCLTVSTTFEEAEGSGYVDMEMIPVGARDIHIVEVASSTNFLALRGEDPDKYFLNGNWTIQWDGDYEVAGTIFTYSRYGDLENLTSPGPTREPLWIQLLFQTSNPGVHIQYIAPLGMVTRGQGHLPKFSWSFGPWTQCSVSCGSGMQRQNVHCMEQHTGLVDERHCDPLERPEDQQRPCNEEPCPARWWTGEWRPCTHSCGPSGLAVRSVLCIRSVSLDEQSALKPADCGHLVPPASEIPCNRHVPCPHTWVVGDWSQCSVTCGVGIQRRMVECSHGDSCDEAQRPASENPCSQRPCEGPDGSGSGFSSHENLNEVDIVPGRRAPSPPTPVPASMSNAIEDPFLEPVVVDDFYYDYNFITFHENLEAGPYPQQGSDQRDIWGWISPTDIPTPAAESLPDWSPTPSQADHSPSLPFEQTLRDPEDNLSSEASDPRVPQSAWPLAPGDNTESPAVPGSEDGSNWLSPPGWESSEEPTVRRVQPLLPDASIQQLWTIRPGDPELWPAATEPRGWEVPTLSPTGPSLVGARTFLLTAPTGPGHALPSTKPPPSAPQHRPANSSQAPDAHLDVSLNGEGPPSLVPPARNASWEVGDWSECSTTCGLGAVWRPVYCSSGRDEDCAPDGRPQPARRCHLRPCATWRTGNWSKCSRSCGGGVSVRDVQCVDAWDLRPLRPFHCQLGPVQPPTRQPCGTRPCLSWSTSSWRECSEACGGGQQQRLVTCPEPGLCDDEMRPNSSQPCNTQPCTQWAVGPWGQCSALCGGGVQRRLVSCVNMQTGLPEEDSDQCSHEAWPESSRPCGTQDCIPLVPLNCEWDRLIFSACETLRLLGRCQLPTVRTQCCRTCRLDDFSDLARGHQRAARR